MAMDLRRLIDTLQEFADEYGDDVEVKLAMQPSWPFEYSIGDVGIVKASKAGRRSRDAEPAVVYIGEGQQTGYLSGRAARAVGFSSGRDDDDDDECEICGDPVEEGRTLCAPCRTGHGVDRQSRHIATPQGPVSDRSMGTAADYGTRGDNDEADQPYRPDFDTRDREGRDCDHDWQEQPGEPPVDVCSQCGAVRR